METKEEDTRGGRVGKEGGGGGEGIAGEVGKKEQDAKVFPKPI